MPAEKKRNKSKPNLTIDRDELLDESLFLSEVADAANNPRRLTFILSSAETCQLQLVAKLVSAVVLCKAEAPPHLLDRLRTSSRRSAIKKQFAFKTRLAHLLHRPHDDIAEALRLLLPLLSDIVGCFVKCAAPSEGDDDSEPKKEESDEAQDDSEEVDEQTAEEPEEKEGEEIEKDKDDAIKMVVDL